MLRRMICATSIMALAMCVGVSAQAKTVSINFTDGGSTLAPGDVAGYEAVGNWNNATSPGAGVLDGTIAGQLVDDLGADSGLVFSYGTGGLRGINTPTGGSAADQTLFTNGWESNINPGVQSTNQFMIENLDTVFADGYSVIWYFGDSSLTFQAAQGSIYRSTDSAAFVPGIGPTEPDVPALGTEIVGSAQAGALNGAAFDGTFSTGANGNTFIDMGLSDGTLVYSFRQTQGDPTFWGMNNVGVQIVGNSPVPEPSTMVLAGIGLVGLVGFGLRRRSK